MRIGNISLESSTASYSIVTLIWKRPLVLLRNLLTTLVNQTLPPAEIIISDNNPDADEAATVEELCRKFDAVYIRTPMDEFHASRGVNIGIKATSPDSDYVAVCGSEMMFSANYLEELDKAMTPEHFTHMLCGTMLPNIDIPDNPHDDWERLCKAIVPKSNTVISPGTFMCTSRDWWFKVRGSDEGIYFLLFDVDFVHRANLSGLEKLWLPWHIAQALHQYHPPSPLFHTARGKWYPQVLGDKSIIRNSESWGI